jgi:hypothetical protein
MAFKRIKRFETYLQESLTPFTMLPVNQTLQPGYLPSELFLGYCASPDICQHAHTLWDRGITRPGVPRDIDINMLRPTQPSIEQAGVERAMSKNLTPIVVMRYASRNGFYILDGHHRACAARAKQLKTIPAYVVDVE